jgi:hypothetical protein
MRGQPPAAEPPDDGRGATRSVSVIARPDGNPPVHYRLYCTTCGYIGAVAPDALHLEGETHMMGHGVFPRRDS